VNTRHADADHVVGAQHAAGRLGAGDGDEWKHAAGSSGSLEKLATGDFVHGRLHWEGGTSDPLSIPPDDGACKQIARFRMAAVADLSGCYKGCMQSACLVVWLTGVYPLWRAWQANRQTSLLHADYWTIASWAAWGMALATATSWPTPVATASCYAALSLTGCATVAVLGARRPGVGAWNFVVAALLGVDLLGWAESLWTAGTLQLDVFRLSCLVGPVAMGVLNYLPTRLAPAALALLLGCALELAALLTSTPSRQEYRLVLELGWLALAFTPWIAYACVRGGKPAASEFDRLWLDFRNRFGFLWGQRLREQFNRSAANTGWPVVLRWQGLRLLPGRLWPQAAAQTAMLATLRALLKRFGPEEFQV